MSTKGDRHRQILDLLTRNEIESQDQLLALLSVEGVTVTQSTLSRDLRELGIVKKEEGYRLGPLGSTALERLARTLAADVESADRGGALAVLRPRAEIAPRDLAGRIEAANLHQIVAALAADDRVLVVARSPAYAREWVRALQQNARKSPLGWLRRR